MEGTLRLARREAWALSQFSEAELGDKRRTHRLVKLGAQMAGNSGGSIPQQTGGVADMKAAYRLFASEDVTHAAICGPHFQQTREAAARLKCAFLVQDTCVLNFSSHKACEGLGPIAENERLRGLHQQNVLAVDPVRRRPVGLMHQHLYCRQSRPPGSHGNRAGRRAVPLNERESHWWIESIRAIGPCPPGTRWVHVGDRGEDIFGVYDECRRQGTDWLIRISQDRRVQTPAGEDRLFRYARNLPARTEVKVTIRRGSDRKLEEVVLQVAVGEVTLFPSRGEAAYRDCAPITCRVIRVWEALPPDDEEELEWLLCTSLECEEESQTQFAALGYALRWLIEELHKCEKTGCQVEMRRLESVERLEPLIGLLSVLAVWLLQLKYVARDEPDAPATSVFTPSMVDAMARYLRRPAQGLTVAMFWSGIGRLGGHPGRKGDGPIGWLRAWRGWQSFQMIMIGADLYRDTADEKCG